MNISIYAKEAADALLINLGMFDAVFHSKLIDNTRISYQQAIDAATADSADLKRDEFQRIKAICTTGITTWNMEEIAGICNRAIVEIEQRFPIIVQRNNAQKEAAELRAENERLKEAEVNWKKASEEFDRICKENTSGKILLEEKNRRIADLLITNEAMAKLLDSEPFRYGFSKCIRRRWEELKKTWKSE